MGLLSLRQHTHTAYLTGATLSRDATPRNPAPRALSSTGVWSAYTCESGRHTTCARNASVKFNPTPLISLHLSPAHLKSLQPLGVQKPNWCLFENIFPSLDRQATHPPSPSFHLFSFHPSLALSKYRFLQGTQNVFRFLTQHQNTCKFHGLPEPIWI